jgi:thiol:disulfide interchange protein DsbG
LPPAVLAALLTLAPVAQAADKALPPIIQTMQQQGLAHVREFKAGADVRAFAAVAGQQPIAIYVTPDGNAIVGSRIDAKGRNLDAEKVDELAAQPMSDAIWKQLASATWVPDGKASAPRIVYAFSDPNCPYCNRFWEAARPWVDAGKVQLRHVMVGVIRENSSTKAAAILSAKDPTAALASNEHNFQAGGIKPAPNVPADVRKQLDANQALMAELGFQGTPGILYKDKDKDGLVQRVNGMPRPDVLAGMLGPL